MALVTGASRGIGAATARLLASLGAAAAVAGDIRGAGGRAQLSRRAHRNRDRPGAAAVVAATLIRRARPAAPAASPPASAAPATAGQTPSAGDHDDS